MPNYIKDFISENVKQYSRLVGTDMEHYPFLTNKKKGDLGELIVSTEMQKIGCIVTPPSKYNGPYDKMIDNIETEIKFSVCQDEDNTFVINHVKTDIQWERFVFYGWNVFKPHQFVWCFKEDMLRCWDETNWWKNQSSPEERIISSANVIKWINSTYTRDISTWEKPNEISNLESFM